MRDENERLKYSLVHASRSAHGFKAMKEAVHEGLNTSELPEPVVARIKDDLSSPIPDIVDDLLKKHEGRSASWVDDIQPYLLQSTPAFRFQFKQIKEELERHDRVWRQTGRKIIYIFS